MDTEEQIEHLENIANIIGKFLLDNGGLANGHQTYAKGYVEISDYYVKLEVHNDDLSRNQRRKLGEELGKKIQNYLKKHAIKEMVKINAILMHSCYETRVNFKPPQVEVCYIRVKK